MNLVNFNEDKLPMQDLETIGLASGGQLLLNVDDLKALLSGRRTGLMELKDLEAENIKIRSLNAKVSLIKDDAGKVNLLIHPIYRKAVAPDILDGNEAEKLQKGEVGSLLKITQDDKGKKTERLVEFDKDTREFIISDTEKILVPDMVNNEFLTPAQKSKYRRGEEVELPDGTAFSYSAVDEHSIRANKIALIASVLIDGGLSYVLYKGLNALFNKPRDEQKAAQLGSGYQAALTDMDEQHRPVSEHHRSYTRSGGSR
jgi:hypothetical protein